MSSIEKIQDELSQPVTDLTMPLPHILARLIRANQTYFLSSRGSFKTSRGIALYMLDMIYEMPRSTGVVVGLSFEHLGDNTLPPLLSAWQSFGILQGEHFVAGKRPPGGWQKPYSGVYEDKYNHVITFKNGTTIHLISLVKKASANGISAQWGVFDEAKFMDEKVLVDEIFPIFRGNEVYFKHSEGYLSKFFATDKLADPVHIKWLLKKRELNNPARNDVVITLALQLNELKMQYYEAGINKKAVLKKQMEEMQIKLSALRQNMTLYIESSGLDTVKIMGKKWLRDKRLNMTEYEFEVGIMNKDPDRPGVGFYPDFKESVHCYQAADDIDADKPFIIAADYQHSVSPICVCQMGSYTGVDALQFVDEIYTLAPEGLEEAVQLFCDKHKDHRKKVVHYVFDQTAIGRRNNADQYHTIVADTLKRNRWMCIIVYTGAAPSHFKKYSSVQKFLQNKDGKHRHIRINSLRCVKLVISITSAPAYTSQGKTRKNKGGEQEERLDQSETTHFSDVFDQLVHGVLELKQVKQVASGVGRVGIR